MEALLNRYRNIMVLVVLVVGQLLLVAVQVKANQDTALIRVWAVTAVTPLARVLEGVRTKMFGAFHTYVALKGAREESQQLRAEVDRLKLENQFLKTELESAERSQSLSSYQSRTPSRTLQARIIATGAAANSKVVFIDRGSNNGVLKGMAVITPDGIVGKVMASYLTAAQVLLVTDPSFAAGVISQKHRIGGTVRGQGHGTVLVDHMQNEQSVEVGEWFYTSGDDRVFPRGMPVGQVKIVRPGKSFKEVWLVPSGLQAGLQEVLVVLEGVHQPVPENEPQTPGMHLQQPPAVTETPGQPAPGTGTDADRLRQQYQKIGEAQGHKFGEGLPGSKPPNFNLDPQKAAAAPKPSGPKPDSSGAAAAPVKPQTPKPGTSGAVEPPKPQPTMRNPDASATGGDTQAAKPQIASPDGSKPKPQTPRTTTAADPERPAAAPKPAPQQ